MRQTLFVRDVLRFARFSALFWATMTVVLYLVEYACTVQFNLAPAEAAEPVDLFVWGLFAASGLVVGERAFPRELKEHHGLFLFSLPVSRGRLWASLVGTRLVGAVAGFSVALVLRPSVAWRLVQAPGDSILLGVGLGMAFLTLFATGAAVALLFRGAVGTLTTAAVVWTVLAAEMVMTLAYPVTDPGFFSFSPVPDVASVRPRGLVVAGALVSAVLLFLSYRFLRTGEHLMPRRRLRNGATVLVVLLVFVFGVWTFYSPQVLLTWAPRHSGPEDWLTELVVPSPSGERVAVLLESKAWPVVNRLILVDTLTSEVETGTAFAGLTSRYYHPDFPHLSTGMFGWSPEGREVRALWRNDSPLKTLGYLLPGASALAAFSSAGDRRVLKDLDQLEATRWTPAGELLVHRGRDGAVRLLRAGEYRVEPMAQLPSEPGEFRFEPLAWGEPGLGQLLVFGSDVRPARAWRITDEVEELETSSVPVDEPKFIVDGSLSGARRVTESLEAELGSPPLGTGTTTRGVYRTARSLSDYDLPMSVYFARLDCTSRVWDLFVRGRETESWRRISSGLPLVVGGWPLTETSVSSACTDERARLSGPVYPPALPMGPAIDARTGTALFVHADGRQAQLCIFDPASGALVPLEGFEVPLRPSGWPVSGPPELRLQADRFGRRLVFSFRDPNGPDRRESPRCRRRYVEFDPSSGSVWNLSAVPCSTARGSSLLFVYPDGRQLRFDGYPESSLFELGVEGQRRTLWSISSVS